jgi:hypothetical protein
MDKQARFQLLRAKSMKMAVFWDLARCILVDIDQCWRGADCLHHQGDELVFMSG